MFQLVAGVAAPLELTLPTKAAVPRSLTFDTLCVGLTDALERATKRKATSSSDYFRLVEAVWPVACEIAETAKKRCRNPSRPGRFGNARKDCLRGLRRYAVLERLLRDS